MNRDERNNLRAQLYREFIDGHLLRHVYLRRLSEIDGTDAAIERVQVRTATAGSY